MVKFHVGHASLPFALRGRPYIGVPIILGGGYDHWWIECQAFDTNGDVVKELSFDWWRQGATAGESPLINRKSFPFPLGGNDEETLRW